jgi:bacteriorhodopsin
MSIGHVQQLMLEAGLALQQGGAEEIGALTEGSLAVGTAGMFLGMLYFIASGWNVEDAREKEYYIVTIFVPAIAFTLYLSMLLGYGVTNVSIDGESVPIFWGRYADWVFTTPLLLLDLALLAGADRNTIATLIGLDVGMILTGLVASLTNQGALGLSTGAVRIVWWGVSCGFFLALLYFLLGTLTQNARQMSGDVGSLFNTLRNVTVVLWTAYPIVWIVGTEGLSLIPLGPETALYAALDLLAKVGFGILLVRSRDVIGQSARSRAERASGATAD